MPYVKALTEGADNVHASAVRRTWVDEQPAEDAADTEPTFGAVRIPVHTAMLTTKASRNLVEDSAVPFTQILASLFADDVRLADEESFLSSDGVAKPLGLLNTPDVPSVITGDAAAITADGLVDLFYDLPAQYRDNSIFIMNSATEDAVRKLKDDNGQIDPDAYPIGTANGAWVSMANFTEAAAIVMVGLMGATATVAAKVE